MRSLLLAASAFALMLPATAQASLEGVDAGIYELEKSHAFLTWTVRHNGISGYTVNFTDFNAVLDFNPAEPTASAIEVTINPTALQTNHPDPAKKPEWEAKLGNDPKFFNAGTYPTIRFVSTSVEKTGDFTGNVTGDLTFLGVTQPVTLAVTYNGMTNMPWFGQRDLIGFNASTTIDRTAFGLTGTNSASNDVKIEFSGEFLAAE